MTGLTRRDLLAGIGATGVASGLAGRANAASGPALGEARPFSFDALVERARDQAGRAYEPPRIRGADTLERIDFDAHWKIEYRPKNTLQIGDGRAPIRLFHLGKFFKEPVGIHVVRGDESRQVVYDEALFSMPSDSPARQLPSGIGFAGFRVMNPNEKGDWLAFLGAAYFRSAGEDDQYGLSARAVTVDVAMPSPEEFPRFTDFYLIPSEAEDRNLTIAALVDGPSLSGAVRMEIGKDETVVMDMTTRFFARKPISRLGFAPSTSMFWFSETDQPRRIDWRPEVHDSDGLSMVTGGGEEIWRPLNNPDRVMTSSFADENPTGFGLLQRDRRFESYEDDGVFYERRPSLWVEPRGAWGKGAVQLVEIPTDDEIHDNIVAHWVPERPVETGDALAYDYRLTWANDAPYRSQLGKVVATRMGRGGVAGQARPKGVTKLVIDFDGGAVADLDREAEAVALDVSASRGTVSEIEAYSIKTGTGWRAMFDIEATGDEPVELRAFLERDGQPLSETWLYQFHPRRIEA